MRQGLGRQKFLWRRRDVWKTPPVKLRAGGLRIVSLLGRSDLTLYLLAVKSLYRQIGEGDMMILNDGSLRPEDVGRLREHLPALTVLENGEVPTGQCQRGNCWERLMLILDQSKSHYVVQVDSDTLTLDAIGEVVRCYKENRAFTLGTRLGQSIVNVEENAERIQNSASRHVQVEAERSLPRLQGTLGRKYVRGSAGFAGFPRGGNSRDTLEEFSVQMGRLLGDRWREWGSEQVASNYIIANCREAEVLPYPRYACFGPEMDAQQNAFLHFIGTHRYFGGVYADRAGTVVRALGHGSQ